MLHNDVWRRQAEPDDTYVSHCLDGRPSSSGSSRHRQAQRGKPVVTVGRTRQHLCFALLRWERIFMAIAPVGNVAGYGLMTIFKYGGAHFLL